MHLAPQNAGVLLGLFSCALYLGIMLQPARRVAMRLAAHPEFLLPPASAVVAAAAFLAAAIEPRAASCAIIPSS